MKLPRVRSLERAAVALGLGLAALGCAQAGKIAGSWDPPFGSIILPDLSWAGQTEFFVPDICAAQGDGVYAATGVCAGIAVNFAKVDFFDPATLPAGEQLIDFAALSSPLTATDVKVMGHQIVAVATNVVVGGNPSSAPAARGNLFGLQFSLTSPQLVCVLCSPTGPVIGNGNVVASVNGMTQTFYTFDDSGQPTLTDAHGNPVGVVLDSSGNFTGYTSPPVPEPGAWAMMLGGLLAVGLLRRRRR